ncbi:hypothetical protein RY972_11325 [Aeromonas allosaccharophila]|uniref:Phage virion morphogenesis protein n=1 Tax=Aeromonas allosaccharophila TaxID=656 RepID=A0ABZ0F674_9GAMM|nr:hypothetical protein [Aeromonas allosaccharophila]WOE64689.1 hypothetical protein RY972_11325 [Aeromonas allosaccharophila]
MQVLFSKGKIWNRHKKQQDMRLFPTIVRRMGRSVKGIPSNPLLLARSDKPSATPEQMRRIGGEKSGSAGTARANPYQSGRGIYQNGIAMRPLNCGDDQDAIASVDKLIATDISRYKKRRHKNGAANAAPNGRVIPK